MRTFFALALNVHALGRDLDLDGSLVLSFGLVSTKVS